MNLTKILKKKQFLVFGIILPKVVKEVSNVTLFMMKIIKENPLQIWVDTLDLYTNCLEILKWIWEMFKDILIIIKVMFKVIEALIVEVIEIFLNLLFLHNKILWISKNNKDNLLLTIINNLRITNFICKLYSFILFIFICCIFLN